MAAARIAAVSLVILATSLAAQQPPPVRLAIQVTDQTGAVIPGAKIQIDAPIDRFHPTATTSAAGAAVIELSPGRHVVYVGEQGFKTSTQNVDSRDYVNRPLTVTLVVEAYSGPVVMVGEYMGPAVENAVIDSNIPLHELPQLDLRRAAKPIHRRFHWL